MIEPVKAKAVWLFLLRAGSFHLAAGPASAVNHAPPYSTLRAVRGVRRSIEAHLARQLGAASVGLESYFVPNLRLTVRCMDAICFGNA